MRCRRVDQLLPAYLDGDLPERLLCRVSSHLDGCERCQAQEASQQRAGRALDAGRRALSIDLWADFSRRLEADAAPRPAWWRQLWQPGLATAFAGIVVALVAQTAPSPSPNRSASSPGVQMAQIAAPRAVLTEGSGQRERPDRAAPLVRPTAAVQPDRARRQRPPVRSLSIPAGRSQGSRSRAIRLADAKIEPAARWVALAARSQLEEPSHRLRTPMHATKSPTAPAAAADQAQARRPLRMAAVPPAGDPMDVAEALVAAQQDAASEQIRGELLLLAQEVTRVGGEEAASGSNHSATGT